MRKIEIEHLLEAAVAKALGVSLAPHRHAARPRRRAVSANRQIKHAA